MYVDNNKNISYKIGGRDLQENNELSILHVAMINGKKANGVECVVPMHLQNQSKNCRVALLNCGEKLVESNDDYEVFNYNTLKEKSITKLPKPFNKPDIIIFHCIYYPVYISLYKQAKKANIPYVIVPHGSLDNTAQANKKLKKVIGNLVLFNKFIKNAKSMQYLCDGEKECSTKFSKINPNCIVAGNGIDISNTKKTYDINNNDEFRMIYIGRYAIYHKGLDLLISTMKKYKKEMKQKKIKLILYGAEHEDDLKELVENSDLEGIVEYNGPVYAEKKIEELIKSDIFMQTSRHEGQPLGVMEAISLGLPCVLTKGTNMGELVEREQIGWMSEFNEERLKDTIFKAFNQKGNFSDITPRAITYGEENFSWDVVAKNTIVEYKKLINRGK